MVNEHSAEDRSAFLLTREWRDVGPAHHQTFWFASDAGPLKVVVDDQRPVCFVRAGEVSLPGPAARRNLSLCTGGGEPVEALYFRRYQELKEFRQRAERSGFELFESDIKPADRFLMERFVTAPATVHGCFRQRGAFTEAVNPRIRPSDYRPTLRWVSLDIETSDIDGDLYSVAVLGSDCERVFMAGAGSNDGTLSFHAGEEQLLSAFFEWFADFDPDLVIGWHVSQFDLDFLQRKCRSLGLSFALGRGGDEAAVLPARNAQQPATARIPGRVVLDGIETLRSAFIHFDDWSLQAVAQELLGSEKLITGEDGRVEEIRRLFREDKARLAAYNLQDCRLVAEIFECCDLVNFAVERARMTGLPLGRFGGSVAAFDNLYLPRLHRRGRVAPDVRQDLEGLTSPGGYVLESRPGLYRHVAVLDFKSLYPAIIRTFRVDPYGLMAPGDDPVPGFLGASFSREDSILPGLIAELWEARDEAKRRGDRSLSQAVKIIMNSFYGVLGSHGCRFFDPRLASSITRRGHEIITRSRDFIAAKGLEVIYGDTDSLFVWLQDAGNEDECRRAAGSLQKELNHWWRRELASDPGVESFLEIEFETLYLRFLMPRIRGLEKGSKKRYAGLVRTAGGGTACVFKGLESVRSDWTPLAREVQRDLYERIFLDRPYHEYLRDIRRRLYAGELDHLLVYRKRLRRELSEYRKNVPPHVQAARKLEKAGRFVDYVITTDGPEPMPANDRTLDYLHYEERQLQPVVDGILLLLDESYEGVCGMQIDLFAG